jgi:Na+-transporting NADH:ubiquinone oxidoreductase subunit NqrD
MNRRFDSHIFWGSYSPLSAFSGMALMVLASSRFAFALICAGALLWVFGLSALIFSYARPIMPVRGRMVILLFLSTFLSGSYMLIAGLLNPLLILGTFFFLFLVPPCCLGSALFEASESEDPVEFFIRALKEAVVLAGIILGLALIREPLGMGTLSFPGGSQGTIEIFGDSDTFIPLKILSVSSGGLLLFGYGVAMFRFFREQNGSVPGENR